MLRTVKNWLGRIHGFGCCPNCGDSYSWKLTDNLPFGDQPLGLIQREDDKLVIILGFQSSVLLCTECLDRPTDMDADRVAAHLNKYGWEQGDIDSVRSAIADFKARQAA